MIRRAGPVVLVLGVLVLLLPDLALAAQQGQVTDPSTLIAPVLPGLTGEGDGPVAMTSADYARLTSAPDSVIEGMEKTGFRAALRRFVAGDQIVVVMAARLDDDIDQFLAGLTSTAGSSSFDDVNGVMRVEFEQEGIQMLGIAYATSAESAVFMFSLNALEDVRAAAEAAQLEHAPSDRSLSDVSEIKGEGRSLAYTIGRLSGFVVIAGLVVVGIVQYVRAQKRARRLPPPPLPPPPPPTV